MSKKHRTQPARRTGLESLESREMMSADPIGGLLAGPLVQHSIVEEAPPLVPHAEAPALLHHDQPSFDFKLDSELGYIANDTIGDVEQTLNSAHGLTGLDSVRANYGFTGIGQTVAVIDSGIAYDHYALGGGYGSEYRVVGGWDFTEKDADPYDDGTEGSHGTHVAGIVGGTGNTNGDDVGVAPGVDLVGLRVFSDSGTGSFGWVEKALQWVIDNRTALENPITAVNLSLGTVWNSDTPPAWGMLEDEFATLKAAGVFIAVSAGNSFTSYNTPGLSYPAASSSVVPVMSVDDSGSLSYFSQRHSRAIAAPGRFIRSTVPDYAGNNNGITDDWANFSGTSMASPYVAGSSVLVREAMELVGYTNITQDTIYDHMMATADTFFDSATSQNYQRLNLSAAIDALLPSDDFGSTVGDAHSLGTLSGDMQLSGMLSTLNDADYFTFTAGMTGTVTFGATSSNGLTAQWDANGQATTQSSGSQVMNVVAGQSYTIGLSTNDGLGYYDLSLSAEASFSFVDWGSVAGQQQHNDLNNSGDQWYRIVAGQSGYVTAEALFAAGQGDIDIAYYDANQTLLASSSQITGGERVDYIASPGEEIFLRISGASSDVDVRLTNQVSFAGSTLTATGTSADDTFSFTAGANYDLTVNGVTYSFASNSVDTVILDAGTGSDTVNLTGSTASETFRLKNGYTQIVAAGYKVTAYSFENVVAQGGGGTDKVQVYDTAGDDVLSVGNNQIQITGSGYDLQMTHFSSSVAYATAGNDTVTMYDSTGNDQLVAWSNRSVLYGTGFFNDVRGFDSVIAIASGGYDRAILYDSTGDEIFEAWSDHATMTGSGFANETRNFDSTIAHATTGTDQAILHDTSGNDFYSAWSNRAVMFGSGYFNDTRGFDSTLAYATGGFDRATFYDTVGNDHYEVGETRAVMTGTGYLNDARNFEYTLAFATEGVDTAVLTDSSGNDSYAAWDWRVVMIGGGYFNDARGFDTTNAYSTGGSDRAKLYDTAGDDTYSAWGNRSLMAGTGYHNEAHDFGTTLGYASYGNDTANLFDTVGSDTYVGWKDRSVMFGSGYFNDTYGFDTTNAQASSGNDRGIVHTSSNSEEVHAKAWGTYITDGTYRNEMRGFNRMYAYDQDGDGGIDSAFVDATDYLFNLIGDWS